MVKRSESQARLFPRDRVENLLARERLRDQCVDSAAVREYMIETCRHDIYWWFNAFVWTFDPRLAKGRTLPFILYPFQEEAVEQIFLHVDRGEDLLIEKSRDMGATYMILGVYLHQFLFNSEVSFLLGSRKEEYVDKRGNDKSLFFKLDHMLSNMPHWMTGDVERRFLALHSHDTGSTINGESTNPNFGRSGRCTSALLDEFAFVTYDGPQVLSATADVTNSRIICSTPQGRGNAYANLRFAGGIDVLSLHWTLHPTKSEGLYYDQKGKPRSPWYDRECVRRGSPREIAQELDIDYLNSGSMFFDEEVLAVVRNYDVREPTYTGELDIRVRPGSRRAECGGFVEGGRGRLKLWCEVLPDGKPPTDTNYVLGVDISAGQGASNSVISVFNKRGEQVAQFWDSEILPHTLAEYAAHLGRWFSGAYGEALLVYENNGEGLVFGDEMLKNWGYRNLYYQHQYYGEMRESKTPGWHSSTEEKNFVLSNLRSSMALNDIVIRCDRIEEEARNYVYNSKGGVDAGAMAKDREGARGTHGDHVIAAALAVLGLRYVKKPDSIPANVPETSWAASRRRYLSNVRREEPWRP